MRDAVSDAGLNPLPKADANSILRRKSVGVLNALLAEYPAIIFRDEPTDDYGVDSSLEIIAGSSVTNFRSQVQIKAEGTAKRNADGSISKSIFTSNFNYLVNGVSPLYLLYVEDRKEIWFTWANDESQRLSRDNVDWRSQDSVTLRFRTRLDQKSLPQIHSRIVKENQLRRSVADTLARSALTENAVVSINLVDLQIVDGALAYTQLIASGLTLVSAGKIKIVQHLLGLIPVLKKRDARILLVAGYAYLAQGRLQTALSFCREAAVAEPSLSQGDADFLEHLRDGCELETGHIGKEEYARRQTEAASRSSAPAVRLFEAARMHHLAAKTHAQRVDALGRLSDLATLVLATNPVDHSLAIQTTIHLALAQGVTNHLWLIETMSDADIKANLGFRWLLPDLDAIGNARKAIRIWRKRCAELTNAAAGSGVAWLLAEAKRVEMLLHVFDLNFRCFASAHLSQIHSPKVEEFDEAISSVQRVIELFRSCDNVIGEMHCDILVADVLFMKGDRKAAATVAIHVKKMAEAMGASDVVFLADAHILGRPILPQSEATSEERSQDSDYSRANDSDESLDQFAKTMVEMQGLPPERFEAVRRDVQTIKQLAKERINWCKHIQLIQELGHNRSRETSFKVDPVRFCICGKYGHQSLFGDPNAVRVVEKF